MKPFFPCAVVLFCLLLLVSPVHAQPSLTALWPVDIGRVWDFNIRVEGPFDQVETGTVTKTVASEILLPSGLTLSCFDVASTLSRTALTGAPEGLSALDHYLWRARPDLRNALSVGKAASSAGRSSLLLAVSECVFDVGLLTDEDVALGSWSGLTGAWEWWWLTADRAPGSTFQLPIRTQIAEDAFVRGEVRTLEGAVTTTAGSFTNAVIVDYVVALGESEVVEAPTTVLGTVSFEVVGWVAFVPGVGPVASEESFAPAEIDCPTCPAEIFETITTTMDLRATTPVSTKPVNFGGLKARY